MVTPSVWGPQWWGALKTSAIHYRQKDGGALWTQFVILFTQAILPCGSCETNFAPVLKKLPPADYQSTAQRRLEWVKLARAEVRRHEARRTPAQWIKRNSGTIAKLIAVLLFIGAAGVVGALIHRRCSSQQSPA
jgi:hypothetical protein